MFVQRINLLHNYNLTLTIVKIVWVFGPNLTAVVRIVHHEKLPVLL